MQQRSRIATFIAQLRDPLFSRPHNVGTTKWSQIRPHYRGLELRVFHAVTDKDKDPDDRYGSDVM